MQSVNHRENYLDNPPMERVFRGAGYSNITHKARYLVLVA